MMKAIIGAFVASSTTVSAAAFTDNCLYCKYMDTNSAAMYSYSWCKERDMCLLDAWNYYNQRCPSEWKVGWKIDIDTDCAVSRSSNCPRAIKATAADIGPDWKNTTQYLYTGTKCTVLLDATEAPVRFLFAN